MSFSKCAAENSFCGRLKVMRINTRPGEPPLDERVDKELSEVMSRNQKHKLSKECGMTLPAIAKTRKQKRNLMLTGGGQSTFSISKSSKILFDRDYPILVNFDASGRMGAIFVPSKIIPKYGINLFREKLQDALDAAIADAKENQELAKKVKIAQRADIGDVPEEDAFSGLEEAFKNALCSLVLHSLVLYNPDLTLGTQEFDIFALDLETLTVFAIEVKKRLGNYIPEWHAESTDGQSKLTVAEKVHQQLLKSKMFIEEWFGGDISEDWIFKPIIFCHKVEDDIKPLCNECVTDVVAESREELVALISRHQRLYRREVSLRHLSDFKLMARYLLFGLAAKSMPTTGRFSQEVSKFMQEAGSWESIMLWCFLTPSQMEILSKPRIVLYSGWGGGKTITGIEVCKIWSQSQKVLILINGYNTDGQTMPLVHCLRLALKSYDNIIVKQINIDTDPLDILEDTAQGFPAIFLDEMPGDEKTLQSVGFQFKMYVLTRHANKVWIALSNYDKMNYERKEQHLELVQDTFKGFEVVTSMNINFRNPWHVKQQVDRSQTKFNETGNTTSIHTIASLNNEMQFPSNMPTSIRSDPQVLLRQVFKDKIMKAVITSSNSEDVLILSLILKHAFKYYHCFSLTKWSNVQVVNQQVENWIQWKPASIPMAPNVMLTTKQFMNGFDTDIVIGLDNQADHFLGDIASRATNQFIHFNELGRFLYHKMSLQGGSFQFDPTLFGGYFLISKIFEFFNNEAMTKEDFIRTLNKSSQEYPSGLMDILFKASIHLDCCFQISAKDIQSGKLSTMSLCSKIKCDCLNKYHLTCSVNKRFLLLMPEEDDILLSPLEVHRCLDLHMNNLSYGYTIYPKSKENEHLKVVINDGDTFRQVVQKNVKDGTKIIYFHTNQRKFCDALQNFLGLEVEENQIFNYHQTEDTIVEFFETELLEKDRHYFVIDLTRSKGVYANLPDLSIDVRTYFKCPMDSNGNSKIQEWMVESPSLFERAFFGQSKIRNDPLNGVEIINHALSKIDLETKSTSIHFFQFGDSVYDFNDHYHHCIRPLFDDHDPDLINDINEENLISHALTFWQSFKERNMPFYQRFDLVTQLFRSAATFLNRRFQIIPMTDNNLLPGSMVTLDPLNLDLELGWKPVIILYIFDAFKSKNGFITLQNKVM